MPPPPPLICAIRTARPPPQLKFESLCAVYSYSILHLQQNLKNPVLGSMTPGTVRLLQAYPSLSSQTSVNGVRRPSTPVGPRMTPFSPLRLMSSNGVFRSAVLDHAVRAPLDEARAGAYTGPARQTILGHQAAGHRRSSWPPTVRGGLAVHEDGGQEPDLAFRRLWRPERSPPPIVRRFPSAPRHGWEPKRQTGSSASPACDGCARRGKRDPNKQFDP